MKYTVLVSDREEGDSYTEVHHIVVDAPNAHTASELALAKVREKYEHPEVSSIWVLFVFVGECVPQDYRPPEEIAEGLPFA